MKLSYRARVALIALLLAFSTLFASCDMLGSFPETTTPATTTIAAPVTNVTTPEESTPEQATPEETTPEQATPEETTPEQTTTTEPPEITITESSTPEVTTPEQTVPNTPVQTEATISFADKANRSEFDASKQVWVQNGITVTNNKGASTTSVADYVKPARFYKNSELIITYPGMTKIVIACNTAAYATDCNNSLAAANVNATVDGKKVTLTFAQAVNSFTFTLSAGQVRVDSITVYTTEGTTPVVPQETTAPEEITTPGEHYPGIPAFSGQKYVEVNGNVPYFTQDDYTTSSYENYSPLDALGRCGVAMACLGKDLMPTGTREELSTKPSGWVQASYDIVDGKYLYNRSHLIGWQLAGENDNERNLITGTRFCNQLCMLPFENMVTDYIKETGNHVLYRVTPLFVGDELVARGVLMEAWSVEDNGDGICFNVFVYNAQPGIVIDYATGKSRLENDTSEKPGDVTPCDYIANKSSKTFHYPDCSSVDKMSDKNKEYHTATHDEMVEMGYKPCGNCNP